jgi:hypothetical protein
LPVRLNFAAGILRGKLLGAGVVGIGDGNQLHVSWQCPGALMANQAAANDRYAHCHF